MSADHNDARGALSSASPIAWDTVARLYDAYVTATFDLPFYLREAAGAGEILELMCGTGRVSLPLAEAGAKLTSVDASAAMISVLRAKLAQRPDLVDAVRIAQEDVRELALGRQFDLALLPFQSFAELITPSDRREALARIFDHVRDGGHFICTLHNPTVRRKSADGLLRLVGRYPLPGWEGSLLVWALATYDAASGLVSGMQFYEEYGSGGELGRKLMLDIRFALLGRDEFEALATDAGFRIAALYGDYDYAPFHQETSPFMIWVLEKPNGRQSQSNAPETA